jgi:hypothetical protein
MGQLEFTEESGHFVYPDVVSKKVGKLVTTTKVKVQIKVTRVFCPSPRFLALVFSSQLHEDLDGAPDAYRENRPGDSLQIGLRPRERHLANAAAPWQVYQAKGHAFRWTGVISATAAFAAKHHLKIDNRDHLRANGSPNTDFREPNEDVTKVGSFPVVQQVGSSRGYYVSPNNVIVEPNARRWDQARYGDPTAMAFAVRTHSWEGKDVLVGDVGWCVNPANGNDLSFVFGDSNKSYHVGECSSFMCRELCDGPPSGAMTFVVFPGLRGGTMSQLTAQGMDGRVRGEMMKLRMIDNGADFARFLSLGADLTAFLRPSQGRPLNPRILAPLARVGYVAPIGDFAAASRSARAG